MSQYVISRPLPLNRKLLELRTKLTKLVVQLVAMDSCAAKLNPPKFYDKDQNSVL